jgi:hypothetical protein
MGTEDQPKNIEESSARPPKPVDNPDLPETGDPDEFEEEDIPDEDFNAGAHGEGAEPLEPPNDLSGIDKEFTD